MQRIIGSLLKANFQVSWIARAKDFYIEMEGLHYIPLKTKAKSGFKFYAEFNIQAYKLALKSDAGILGAVDLDTLMAASWAVRKGRSLVFDAHEYFTEVPELQGRNFVKNYWARLGRKYIPKANIAYTVNQSLSDILGNLYKRRFEVIRNVPLAISIGDKLTSDGPKIISYIGVLNMGRGLHQIIDAMQTLEDEYQLQLIGDGDIKSHLEEKVSQLGMQNRVHFLGYVEPEKIPGLLVNSWCGINLLDSTSLNYYYSLANKFFDYMNANCPQICMDFPEYKLINRKYEVSLLVKNLDPKNIQTAIEKLKDRSTYIRLQENCKRAIKELSWEKEEEKLLAIYKSLDS